MTVTSEAVAETLTPVAGSTDDITLTVKNSDGTTQTNFNGPKTVTISGVLPAPDNSYGSFNDTVLTGSQTVVDAVYFTNGVATVPLVLNKAGSTHTIGFYINDGAVPACHHSGRGR